LYAPTGSQLFIYDGQGNVRALSPMGNAQNVGLEKRFSYDASGNALGFNPVFAGTSILYRGEQFDSRIQQYCSAIFGRTFQRKERKGAEDGRQLSQLMLTMQCNRTADEHRRDFVFWLFVLLCGPPRLYGLR